MRAGRLNRRIVLQRPTLTQDGAGQAVRGWTDVATVWAALEPARGRRTFDAQKVTADCDVVIRIRFRADVDATWRIQQTDRATSPATTKHFRIVAPPDRPHDGRSELVLYCKHFNTGEVA